MHVVVAKKDLLRVLARCQGVADKKSTMPVLGNVLLEVSGTDQLRLAATAARSRRRSKLAEPLRSEPETCSSASR